MKRLFTLTLLISMLCLISCEKYRLSQGLKAMMGSTIALPDSLLSMDGVDVFSLKDISKARMIFWFDSTECVNCKLSSLSLYYDLYDYLRSSDSCVDMLVIFSPSQKNISDFRYNALTYHFEFPVVVDNKNEMWLKNKQIPKSDKLHSFLIDKESKVIMIGNPVTSSTINTFLKDVLLKIEQERNY